MGWSLISCNNIFKILASKILEDSDTRRQVKYYPKWWVLKDFSWSLPQKNLEEMGENDPIWQRRAHLFSHPIWVKSLGLLTGQLHRSPTEPNPSLKASKNAWLQNVQISTVNDDLILAWGKTKGRHVFFSDFFLKKRFGGGSLRKFHDLCFEKKEDIYEVSPY